MAESVSGVQKWVEEDCLNNLLSLTNKFQGAKALEAFIYNIKNDPDKVSNMPRDGTVHELTNHVSTTHSSAKIWGYFGANRDPILC